MKCGKCEYNTDKTNWGSSVEVQQMLLGWHRKDGCSHEDYVEEENCQDGEFLCIDNDRGRALFTKDIYPSPSRYCDICYAYWEKLGRPWMIPGEVKFTTNPKGKEQSLPSGKNLGQSRRIFTPSCARMTMTLTLVTTTMPGHCWRQVWTQTTMEVAGKKVNHARVRCAGMTLRGRGDVKLDNSPAWDRHLTGTLQTVRVNSATTTSGVV